MRAVYLFSLMTFADLSWRALVAPLLSSLLLALAAPGRATEGRPPAKAKPLTGKVLYARNCARCHGLDGRAGLNDAHDLTKSNLNAFGRAYLVTNGMGKMPAFKEYLTPQEVQAVVAYSLTLK